MTHVIVNICRTPHFVSTVQISLPNFAFLPYNHPALLKDWFLKEMLLKEQNPIGFFSRKTIGSDPGSDNFCSLIENNFRFLR